VFEELTANMADLSVSEVIQEAKIEITGPPTFERVFAAVGYLALVSCLRSERQEQLRNTLKLLCKVRQKMREALEPLDEMLESLGEALEQLKNEEPS
jgi:hypothetical protein